MTSVGKNVEKLESLCPVDVNGSDIAAKENSMIMPPKWNIQLVWDPEFHFCRFFLKSTKMLIQKNACTPAFILALFTIVKMWKQFKCPSTDDKDGTYTIQDYS